MATEPRHSPLPFRVLMGNNSPTSHCSKFASLMGGEAQLRKKEENFCSLCVCLPSTISQQAAIPWGLGRAQPPGHQLPGHTSHTKVILGTGQVSQVVAQKPHRVPGNCQGTKWPPETPVPLLLT